MLLKTTYFTGYADENMSFVAGMIQQMLLKHFNKSVKIFGNGFQITG